MSTLPIVLSKNELALSEYKVHLIIRLLADSTLSVEITVSTSVSVVYTSQKTFNSVDWKEFIHASRAFVPPIEASEYAILSNWTEKIIMETEFALRTIIDTERINSNPFHHPFRRD